MFKSKITKGVVDFTDDIFSLISLGFGVMCCFVFVCIAGGFAYHYYPTTTEIILWIIGILFALAVVGWIFEKLQILTKQLKSNKAAK